MIKAAGVHRKLSELELSHIKSNTNLLYGPIEILGYNEPVVVSRYFYNMLMPVLEKNWDIPIHGRFIEHCRQNGCTVDSPEGYAIAEKLLLEHVYTPEEYYFEQFQNFLTKRLRVILR